MHIPGVQSGVNGSFASKAWNCADGENVRAIIEASKPQTPSDVRSFLRLVGFSAKFIPDFAATADPHRRLERQGERFMGVRIKRNHFRN